MESLDMKEEDRMITKSELKTMGWTDGLIKEFLLEPDKIKPNPRYKSASPMKLYFKNKILGIMLTDEFKESFNRSSKRKVAAEKSVTTKLLNTQEEVSKIDFNIPVMNEETLIRNAIYHYRGLKESRSNYESIVDVKELLSMPRSNPFIQRITKNYIRHCLIDYESILSYLSGRVGFSSAYKTIKDSIDKRIENTYPFLITN